MVASRRSAPTAAEPDPPARTRTRTSTTARKIAARKASPRKAAAGGTAAVKRSAPKAPRKTAPRAGAGIDARGTRARSAGASRTADAGTVKAAKTAAKAASARTAAVPARKAAASSPAASAAASSPAASAAARETREAAVAARRATLARTRRLVEAVPIAVDDDDAVARASIALRQARGPFARKPASSVPTRRRRSAVDRLDDPPPARGLALIERVSRAIERELTQIETIVGGHHVPPRQRSEAERRARTLASLARTLREVRMLRAGEKKDAEDDDAVPRDLTELRLALARRLDRLVADAKTAHPEPTE